MQNEFNSLNENSTAKWRLIAGGIIIIIVFVSAWFFYKQQPGKFFPSKESGESGRQSHEDYRDINTARVYADHMNDYSVELETGWEYVDNNGERAYFQYYQNDKKICSLSIFKQLNIEGYSKSSFTRIMEKLEYEPGDKINKKSFTIDGGGGYKYTDDNYVRYVGIITATEKIIGAKTKQSYKLGIDFVYNRDLGQIDEPLKNKIEKNIINSFKNMDFDFFQLERYHDKDEPSITKCQNTDIIFERDKCHYDLAIKNGNADGCELIEASRVREKCIKYFL